MHYWYMRIFRELLDNDIKFVVAGGIAVNLLGVPRFTADLDLIIALDEKNVSKFVKCVSKLGYEPKLPVKAESLAKKENRDLWFKEKNMVVFSFWNPKRSYEVIDVFIKESIPFETLWKERTKIRIERVILPVISIKHLKKLKKGVGRDQDISDIEALDKLQKELNGKK